MVLGGGGVGKSALVIRLVTDNFMEEVRREVLLWLSLTTTTTQLQQLQQRAISLLLSLY